MKARTKYTNLNNIPQEFTKEEWELAVSVIEFLPHNILVQLNNEFGIKFVGGNETMDDESLITTLLGSDVSKEITMQIANRYKHTLE